MTDSPRTVTLLGSTGSIGTQAIEIVQANPDRFRVVGISAGGRDLRQVARQAVQLQVEQVGVATGSADALRELIRQEVASTGEASYEPQIEVGEAASEKLAGAGADVVLNGITGSIGLRPTLAALEHGSTLALANKESLIVGGPIVKRAAAPGQIVPVDSEHSAIAQCLRVGRAEDVRKLVVTASGGPFRGMQRDRMRSVTPEQALAHPTWNMGPMVTTNSATLVNKGLEVIEAHLLFDVPFDRIEVVVHPQSIVHSMVQYVDGTTIAQASPPSMLIPIALGLDWPHRVHDAAPAMDWTTVQDWRFEPLDGEAFPAVGLARRAGAAGSTYPAVFNAANEECVAAFHRREIGFLDIVDTVEQVVDLHDAAPHGTLTVDDVLDAERWARARAQQLLSQP